MRMRMHGTRPHSAGKSAFTGMAVAAVLAAVASPASAIPGYADTNFRCQGVDGILDRSSLAQPDASERWATWSLSTNMGNGGLPYGDSRVRILSLASADGSVEVMSQEPATRKRKKQQAIRTQQVTECRNAFTGQVASIALVTAPPVTPPAFVSSGRSAPQATAGRYDGWVIRSDGDPSSGCVLASPRDQYQDADLRQFCLDGQTPRLWDVVDIDHEPGQGSAVTVTGTLTAFRASP